MVQKSKSIFILMATLLISLSSCINSPNSTTNVYQTDIQETKVSVDKTVCYKTPVIGNLYLGVTEQEFKKQKKAFMQKHKKLDRLHIKDIRGYVYNGKIERIIIISQPYKFENPYSAYSIMPEDYYYPWKTLYDKKYNITDDFLGATFHKNGQEYIINDNLPVNDSWLPQSFTDSGLMLPYVGHPDDLNKSIKVFSAIDIINYHLNNELIEKSKSNREQEELRDLEVI